MSYDQMLMLKDSTRVSKEFNVDFQLVNRIWSNVTRCTTRDGWTEFGAYELPVQGTSVLPCKYVC
jgi:hypothetical protein